MIVVDSNIIAARSLTSISTRKAEQIEQKDPVWIVPVLWRYEFQNILATAIKTEQISAEEALRVLERVFDTLLENEAEPSPARVIDLVARYGITAHDGQFIALAEEMGIMCVTEDRELQKKFPQTAISAERFLQDSAIKGVHERKSKYGKQRR